MLEDDKEASAPKDHNFSEIFERQLPDNCVEYFVVHVCETHAPDDGIADLTEAQSVANQLSQSLTRDYIWQRDDFRLELVEKDGLQYLHGMTDYGDDIEDEWLVVYILRELTRSHPKLWIRVIDSEEEFLLTEAANVLPAWLSPEMDQNRVWINNGQLYIIPLGVDGGIGTKSEALTLHQAVDFIRLRKNCLVHSPLIQAEAFYRLEKYPDQITESVHQSLATIPRKLAHLLHVLPKSISPAVESFYLRDAISLRPLISTTGFLQFPPEDLVTTSVRFSRVLFAQIKSQYFEPPPRWRKIFADTLASNSLARNEAMARLELGMKLTCGFEILATRSFDENRGHYRGSIVKDFAKLLEALAKSGHASLPTDEEMGAWQDGRRDDDDTWLDINYGDFQRELEGRAGNGATMEFGSARTQADLRKIVSRFESFLNDKSAGLDGADVGEANDDTGDEEEEHDDESNCQGDQDNEAEDDIVSFDEEAFSRMMREVMGIPIAGSAMTVSGKEMARSQAPTNEDAQIQQVASQMEAELKQAGALTLGDAHGNVREHITRGNRDEQAGSATHRDPDSHREDDKAEVDVDYNLACNILESFKSQAGMAGPASNLLGLMGIRLPRDDDDDGGDEEKDQS